MEEKSVATSLGFVMDLEKILNYLVEHNEYMAQIGSTTIRYLGKKTDTENSARQVFEIERKV